MKKLHTVLLALACALLACVFTGCGMADQPAPTRDAVCDVLANTACSQGLNLNSPLVVQTAERTIRGEGYISVINLDGKPSPVIAGSYVIPDEYRNASAQRLEADVQANAAGLLHAMQGVVAKEPEADYLAGLRLAVRDLSSLDGYDARSIIVVGNGLGTCGDQLNFHNNLISADPEDIVAILQEREAIPDFTGINVYWQQMGDFAAPMEAATPHQKNAMCRIYQSIVEAGGGTFEYVETMPGPVSAAVEYPTVTPVDFPAETPTYFDAGQAADFSQPLILGEHQIPFVPDSAEYLDPDQAAEILRPIAEQLAQSSTAILLCGTTAGDQNSSSAMELSAARAAHVKQTLAELGANPEWITDIGLGSANPWHIQGAGYEGPGAAANRKVVLMDASSDAAQAILEGSNS